MSSNSVVSLFGTSVFNETAMRDRLPKNIYNSLKKTIDQGEPLAEDVAQIVANAMKDWATEKGVTHFTHWFQPMTGITAEKHDAFVTPAGEGKIIMEFSGKELIRGEPDASSFPSGGLRSTFEARGYTAWDATSYAFIKDDTLCIPTAFCSYSGEALDQKTPLLRSMEVINREALHMLKLFGSSASRVISTVGAEQEYFLVDENLFRQRQDLIFSGRSLFGAMPPKGQEMDDHYFGNLKDRVSAYMKDLDRELWKLGVYAKTKHNEAAPAQHELASIYTTANLTADHNQLIMEMMKRIAKRHDLVCLLHEKPFAGVNGSGKHNNWSLSTDTGEALLSPGKDPAHNPQFLIFLAAVISAVDTYSESLRASVATAGNDHRLGANEAPPAIISIFLGDALSNVLDHIQTGAMQTEAAPPVALGAFPEIQRTAGLENIKDNQLKKQQGALLLDMGVTSLPDLFKDTNDRNRTSPFAFTGNKFEFRMVGSSQSISACNVVLNTAVAHVLSGFSKRLEQAESFEEEVYNIVRDVVMQSGRVIFNGNNYSEDWVVEAERRGLPNDRSTMAALSKYLLEKNVDLFTRYGIFTRQEMEARHDIMLESYIKTLNIEALCMVTMVHRQILPACLKYMGCVADTLARQEKLGLTTIKNQQALARRLSAMIEELMEKNETLETLSDRVATLSDHQSQAMFYADNILPAMEALRQVADGLEEVMPEDVWPFPSYHQLLFSV